ncbi:MAG: pimeloyl-ACP methyl ester carboxylesterase [Granulosicoccus sp.]|jgi:pimeloyl-ACP methyl ester carboxylesterase
MQPQIESVTLNVDGKTVTGIRQHDPSIKDAPQMLAIHGWLDNANSFVPLMPYLPAFDLVAIDLPGNGYSDWLSQGYSFHELCYQLTRIIESLGWEQCHILGHSLGGCIAPMLAVANPQMVKTLTLIEASGPLSEAPDKLPARVAKAMKDRLDPRRFESRLFDNKREAIEARLRAAKMAPTSAKLIVDRQVVKEDGGYRWRFDPRWRMASAQYQTEEQVKAVLSAVPCPTLAVIADEGYLAQRPEHESRLACLQERHSVTLPGHHHLHMDSPEPVAAAINDFLKTLPAMGG